MYKAKKLAVILATAGCLSSMGIAAYAQQQGAPGGPPPVVGSGGLAKSTGPGANAGAGEQTGTRNSMGTDCGGQRSDKERERCMNVARERADPRSGSSGGGSN